MTMLDRMRRHRGWLKWSLALVVVAFIALYFPEFVPQDTGMAAPGDVVATVGSEEITAGEFRRAYLGQLAMYQRAYGSNVNVQMLRQMGIDQQILQQLVDERAAEQEARRLGLRVSDAEVAQRIRAIPGFQRDGRFSPEVYRMALRTATPPMTVAEFEEGLRRQLLVDKLRSALTDWVAVSDAEIEQEFRRRNEKVKLELVVFTPDRFRDQASVSDADVAKHFEAHTEDYRVPEKRKIRFLLVDVESLKSSITVSPDDVERAYNERIEQFTTPEQVRASHILLQTEGKDEVEVRARAEALLKQVRGGADFGALAAKHSEDEASASQQGDLDYFGRGRMVKEFEDVAFSLEPGQVSDLVKSQFGYHIIKVTDKKPETRRTLEEVRAQLTDQIATERAQTRAGEIAAALEKEIDEASDLETAAKARGLKVQESGFFARDEPIMGIGPAQQVSEGAFDLQEGAVSGPIRAPGGHVFFTTIGKQDAYVPKLDDVKDRVREDALRAKAAELARSRAREIATALRSDFTKAARDAGLDVKSTELVTRGSMLPEVGSSPAVDGAVFELPQGGVSDPIGTPAGTVVARVVERQDIDAAAMAAAKDELRRELVGAQRARFFEAYMRKAQERLQTRIHQDVVQSAAGM